MVAIRVLFCLALITTTTFGEITVTPPRGYYTAPVEVSIRSNIPKAKLYYSTDGSQPTVANSKRFENSITVAKPTALRIVESIDGHLSESSVTHTYLFVDQVADQPAQPEGYITEVDSWRLSHTQVFDWAMDPDIVTNTAENGLLSDHLLALPTIAISMDRDNFNHLYENHTERGIDYERPASMELLYPSDEQFAPFEGFQINCGLRIQGGGASVKTRKKSFRLLFKKDHGPGKLRYPLFESATHHATTATDVFDNVILRAGGNANWSKDEAWKHEPTTYLRDPLVPDSQIAACGYGARSVFAHVTVNGLYLGLYNLAERPDDKFQASYWGGTPEDYHAFNHGGTVSGDAESWDSLVNLARYERDSIDRLYEQIDVVGYCDYLIVHWLCGSGDWPWNNYYGGHRLSPQQGPVRFFTWDAEFSLWTHLGYLESNNQAWANPLFVHGHGRRRSPIITLWNALQQHPDFKTIFADRVYKHCFHDGALTDAQMQARLRNLMATIEGPIVAESARWGDSAWGQEDAPRTREGQWRPQCQEILRLLEGNVAVFIHALQAESLYPELKPPTFPRPTEPVTMPHLVHAQNPNPLGTIYYTVDGSDPRTSVSALVAPTAKIFNDKPLRLSGTTLLRTRTWHDGLWSPLAEHLFINSLVRLPVRINELMIDPPDNEALEFIELKNVSAAAIDIGGFSFEGIDYRFPPKTTLAGGEIVVLIPNDDPPLFSKKYPKVSVFGHYRKHLSNQADIIAIRDRKGQIVTKVKYGGDAGPWPSEAKGNGKSLQPKHPLHAPNHSSDWKASRTNGGSPGL